MTFCVAAVLSCQLYVERQARNFERELLVLNGSTQSRLMQGSGSLAENTRWYSISELQSIRQKNVFNFLCFRRELFVTFRSTNYVGRNVSESWAHAQGYLVGPWSIDLESSESACDAVRKFGPYSAD